MQQVSRLEQPVIIVSPEAYFQGCLNGVFTQKYGQEYWEGMRVVISNHLNKDEHVTTLKDMECNSNYPN